MKENDKLVEISFAMIAGEHHQLVIDNFFLLNDNLDNNDPIIQKARMEQAAAVMPFKMMFTLVIVCRKGTIKLQVNLMDYEIKANDAFLITPGSIFDGLEVSADSQIMMMALAPEGEGSPLNIAPAHLRKYFMKPMLFHASPEDIEEVTDIYKLMRRTMQKPYNEYVKEAVMHYLAIMTCNLKMQKDALEQQQDYRQPTRQEQIMIDFMQEVHDHCVAHRDLKFYADRLCLSTAYLAHVISETSGKRASQWIKEAVILEAKAMLKKNCTVQQVSHALNFANQSFFGKYFKKAVGCSPRQYQQK